MIQNHGLCFLKMRSPGILFPLRRCESNCVFLYHEMYSTPGGYEVHMMFAMRGRGELVYLTVKCRDIRFGDNITP